MFSFVFFDGISGVANNHSTSGTPIISTMLESLMAEMRIQIEVSKRIVSKALRGQDTRCLQNEEARRIVDEALQAQGVCAVVE